MSVAVSRHSYGVDEYGLNLPEASEKQKDRGQKKSKSMYEYPAA